MPILEHEERVARKPPKRTNVLHAPFANFTHATMLVTVFENLHELKPLTVVNAEPKVFVWNHQLNSDTITQLAQKHLPTWMVENEVTKFSNKRRVERLSVRLILNQLLGADAIIDYEESGRPFLTKHNIEISISHTKNAYAVSLATVRHGLDIEQWSNKALKVKSMFVNDNEAKMLTSPTPLACTTEMAATTLWSAKEAAYKLKSIAGLSLKQDIELTLLSDHLLEVYYPNNPPHKALIAYEQLETCVVTCCKNI